MHSFTTAFSIAAMSFVMVMTAAAQTKAFEASTQGKKLIQYGWDSPDTAYLRKNLRRMERSPFDGIMLTVRPQRGGEGKLGGMDSLGWMVFKPKKFTSEMYLHAIEDLKAARSRKFTDHFIAVVSHPDASGLDWFDDAAWATVAHNIGALAKVAKAGGCAGLMFDPEEYDFPLWTYAKMSEQARGGRAYDAYVAQVRQRGREFITAINAEFRDVTILTLYGPYLYAQNVHRVGAAKTPQAEYNFLGPFYDGMLEAATPQTTLVDGYEQSYSFKTEEQFTKGRRDMLEQPKALSAVPEKFAERVRCGFGIWLDYNSGQLGGWFPPDAGKNHFTPAELRNSLHFALKHSDKYVWVYNERSLWWAKRPGEAYEKAFRAAR